MFEHTGTTSRLKVTRYDGLNEYASEPYTTYMMGILSGSPNYNIQRGEISFPVEFYIANDHHIFSRDKPVRKEGPLIVSAGSFKNYGKYIYHHYIQGDLGAMPHEHSMKIIFGDKEVYLRQKSEQNQDDYTSLFEQKRLVGPYDEKTKALPLSILPEI